MHRDHAQDPPSWPGHPSLISESAGGFSIRISCSSLSKVRGTYNLKMNVESTKMSSFVTVTFDKPKSKFQSQPSPSPIGFDITSNCSEVLEHMASQKYQFLAIQKTLFLFSIDVTW